MKDFRFKLAFTFIIVSSGFSAPHYLIFIKLWIEKQNQCVLLIEIELLHIEKVNKCHMCESGAVIFNTFASIRARRTRDPELVLWNEGLHIVIISYTESINYSKKMGGIHDIVVAFSMFIATCVCVCLLHNSKNDIAFVS